MGIFAMPMALQEKRHNTTSIIATKNIIEVIYTIASLGCFLL